MVDEPGIEKSRMIYVSVQVCLMILLLYLNFDLLDSKAVSTSSVAENCMYIFCPPGSDADCSKYDWLLSGCLNLHNLP